MTPLDDLLEIAQRASIDAGIAILDIYDTDFEVDYKKDQSPLTVADQKANDIIMSYLTKLDIPIISEENDQIVFEDRKEWQQFWLVDPLDGTKEFINKNGEFTVNIALIEEGIPVIGVIYVPATRELFYASLNGAYRQTNISNFTEVNKSHAIRLNPKPCSNDVVVAASRSHLSKETIAYIDSVKNTEGIQNVRVVKAGSSLKMCMVADGRADVYPRLAPTMEWDTGAGDAICRAVGIKVLQVGEYDMPLAYNKEDLTNPWFVVGNRFGT